MYSYNDAIAYDPNVTSQPVPNMLNDEMQNMGNIQVQEGANMTAAGTMTAANGVAPQTVPVYAIDSSVQQFEIPDPIMRRSFARKVFMLLLLQHIIMLPIIEIFIISTDEPLPATVYGSLGLVTFCIFCGMYFFSDVRRYAPMNVVALVLVTLLIASEEGVYATQLQSQLALFPVLIAIVQLLAVIAYSKQVRYKFSNINVMLLIVVVYVICLGIVQIILMEHYIYTISAVSVFHVMYFVYDMQLMLSGHHGYNLQPTEHIFAATNIYADMPNLLWRFLRYVFITPLVKMYQFFVACCFAEVC